MNYKIVLLQLFIGIGICDPTNTGHSFRTSNNTENWNGTSNAPSGVPAVKDKVTIKVYYETLCPFSVDFFVYQLKPTVERLGSHIDIHLIPYGHAKDEKSSKYFFRSGWSATLYLERKGQTFEFRGQCNSTTGDTTRRVFGGYKFSCQHGIPECFGNTVQACAIDALRNTTQTVAFNTCLMQNTSYRTGYQYFISIFHWCGTQHDVNVQEIWECVNSERGSILLKQYGDETHALAPSFVPFLTIDGSTEYQDVAIRDLFPTVCLMLKPIPTECTTI